MGNRSNGLSETFSKRRNKARARLRKRSGRPEPSRAEGRGPRASRLPGYSAKQSLRRALSGGRGEGQLALTFRGARGARGAGGGAAWSGPPRAMPLPDTMFCAQQIQIPPELPDILKQFTKAAIRTQPADVLQWSAGYFSALSRGDPLPVKDRIEMPVATQKTDTGLTQGLLKVLHKQCSHKQYVELADLEQKWKNLCLPIENFRALLQLDPCEDKIEWIKFLALGCSMLGGSLNSSMKHLCEILTTDPEGGPARIPFETFSYVYRYLSRMDSDIHEVDTESYLATLKDTLESRKNGMIGLSDFFVLTRKV